MINNGLKRIYLNQLLELINKKDSRSAISWCQKNGVEIYSDTSGKYVVLAEFNYAYNKPVVTKLQKKYGERWVEVFELCIENKLHLDGIQNQDRGGSQRYIAKSITGRDFLNKQNIN